MLPQRRIEEAMALHREGRLDEAAQKYEALLTLAPGDPNLLNLQGILAGQMGDYTKSLMLLHRAIEADSKAPQFRNSIAVTLERIGNIAEAATAFNDEGNLLLPLYRAAEALTAFGHARRLMPASPQYRCNYAVALIRLGRPQEAADLLAATPDEGTLSYIPLNLGNALAGLPKPYEAIAAYDRTLAMEPGLVEAHWARGQMLLLLGDYEQGLAEYEWRKKWQAFENPFRAMREWQGEAPEALNGKLLVVTEQGYGDTIQFSRYAMILAAQGYTIILEVLDPLYPLMSEGLRYPGIEVVARSAMASRVGECAAHVLLMSLPYHFATRVDTIPAETPYLTVSEARIAQQNSRLPKCNHKRIGIVRAGQSLHGGDYARSISAATLRPLLEADVDFHSLQIVKFDHPEVSELGLEFKDFADTAAAIMAMDLIITVDTSVAHLAGALGKPVWILIPYAPDWRWGLHGTKTGWYKTARLFRQARDSDWPSVIAEVRTALDEYFGVQTVGSHTASSPEQSDAMKDTSAAGLIAEAEALIIAGNGPGAVAAAERALAIDPTQPAYYRVFAAANAAAGDTQKAAMLYAELADAEQRDGLLEDAASDYAKAIAHDATNPHLFNNYGVTLRMLKRSDEAIAAFSHALDIDPTLYSSLSNRANMYWDAGQQEAAFSDHRAAIAARPDDAQIHHNYAVALRETGAYREALAEYDRAIELKPDFALAQYDRGQLLAQMGDLKAGFAGMEWRWAPAYNYKEKPRGYKQPVWRGQLPENLRGKLLVISEQGLGDTIQFSRYAPLLVDCGYRVVLEVQQPLYSLYGETFVRPNLRVVARQPQPQSSKGIGGLLGLGGGTPDFAAFVGLMSLPERFMTTLDTIPATTPYLSVRESHKTKWAARLKAPPGKLKVGLVWQGDPKHAQDKTRSLPPALLHPLLENSNVQFYALQKGPMADWRFPQANVAILGPELTDFCDTAAVIENLDLVISVDTAVAHLAGALNCPVWIMLTKVGEWRWLTGGDTTPWYPSARLFRQEVQGQWQDVVERMAGELSVIASEKRSNPD